MAPTNDHGFCACRAPGVNRFTAVQRMCQDDNDGGGGRGVGGIAEVAPFQVSSFFTHSGDFCVRVARCLCVFLFVLPSHLTQVCVWYVGPKRVIAFADVTVAVARGRLRVMYCLMCRRVCQCAFFFLLLANAHSNSRFCGSLIEFDIVILWDARVKVCVCKFVCVPATPKDENKCSRVCVVKRRRRQQRKVFAL